MTLPQPFEAYSPPSRPDVLRCCFTSVIDVWYPVSEYYLLLIYLFQGRVQFPTGGESPRTPFGADPVELRSRR